MVKLGKLKSLGISEPWQAALYPPVGYIDCRFPITHFNVGGYQEGIVFTFVGKLKPNSIELEYKQSIRVKARLFDDSGNELRFMLFTNKRNVEQVKQKLLESDWIALLGEVSYLGATMWCHKAKQIEVSEVGKVMPQYNGKRGVLKPETVLHWQKQHLHEVMPQAETELRELLHKIFNSNKQIREILRCHNMTLKEVLAQAHFPDTPEQGERCIKILNRVAAVAMLSELKKISHRLTEQHRQPLNLTKWRENCSGLPFQLTHEQTSAVERITNDLAKPHVLKAMLIGDVGSGKTAVYGLVVAAVIKAGGRVAIMLPAKNLAEEKHQEFCRYWPELDAQLVCDGAKVINEDSALWIGTTGLLSKKWKHDFDLVVIDEQHKFGTEQRNALLAGTTSLLEVTATPIPRTYCWMRHGLVPVYTLRECHVNKEFVSRIYQRQEGKLLLQSVFKSLNAGSKILIICPRKEDADNPSPDNPMADLNSVEDMHQKWSKLIQRNQSKFNKHIIVGKAHSGIDAQTNETTMQAFKTGQINILIATTVVECGLTVPNLNHVLIYSPERLGAVTLHQLRGRGARAGGTCCFDMFLPYKVSDKSLARLEQIRTTTDGFELALLDMQNRGVGDIKESGTLQHGASNIGVYGQTVPLSLIEEIGAQIDMEIKT
ncbi:helicase-related protein [Motilimonas eburnea]|uniref:helicase-related protein n=1 Tax=Motilimonas eburnea TaxID=1737488 RepID=UPI001E5557B0|nr:helicase-related protein [Motilimonas eburnea]MCE2571654.1 DEAD/DEAH box helicase family protein [Motilimonas eburnea]